LEGCEEKYKGPITGLEFDYHTGTDEIHVECGRMDEEWR